MRSPYELSEKEFESLLMAAEEKYKSRISRYMLRRALAVVYDFLEKHVEYIGYQTACFDRQGNEITDVSDLDKLNCFFDFRKIKP